MTMSSLVFDFEAMGQKGEKATKEVIKRFKKAAIQVVAQDISATKRTSGISYREMTLSFADSQKVAFLIKQTGDIFKVKINNKEFPIKNQNNHEAAINEVISKLDNERAKFQKMLVKAKVPLPPKMKSTLSQSEKGLIEQNNALDLAIQEAEKHLLTLKEIK